jgi:hypothetical protein
MYILNLISSEPKIVLFSTGFEPLHPWRCHPQIPFFLCCENKVLSQTQTNRILLYLEDVSTSCTFDATLFGSFNVEQKITTRWAIDSLFFVAFWFSSCRWFRSRCWFSSGFWFPITRLNLFCQLTHPTAVSTSFFLCFLFCLLLRFSVCFLFCF